MKYVIKISDSAFGDLEFIKNFIALDNKQKSDEYIKELFAKIDCLSSFPYLGKKASEKKIAVKDIYLLPCLKHIVVYKVYEGTKTVQLLSVVSHYQNWEKILEEKEAE